MSIESLKTNWTNYWRLAPVDACMGQPGETNSYLGEFWKNYFLNLKTSGRLIDLCTGRGVLPYLWSTQASNMRANLTIDAIDIADVNFPWLKENENFRSSISLHRNINCEQLPFKDDSFDYMVSQYGLEYSSLIASIPELSRIAKPLAQLKWIAHHASSVFSKVSLEEIKHQNYLLNSKSPVAILSDFANLLVIGDLANSKTAHSQYSQELFNLTEKCKKSNTPDALIEAYNFCIQIEKAIQAGHGSLAIKKIADYRGELMLSAFRLKHLVDCAVDISKLRLIENMLKTNGFFAIEANEVIDPQNGLLAWAITANKV